MDATNVKALRVAATGAVTDCRARIVGVYITQAPSAAAGSVIFRDGGGAGAIILQLDTIAASATPSPIVVNLHDFGILAKTSLHVTLTTVASVTTIYQA